MNYILIFLLGLVCVPYAITSVDITEDIADRVISAVISGIIVWAGAVVWGTLQ